MSSPQAIDAAKLERAAAIAIQAATDEKRDSALADATAKNDAVMEAKDGDRDMADPEAQAGRRLARSVIEMRLKQLNPNLRFERAHQDPTRCGIYLGPQYITWMNWEASTEFTINYIATNDQTGQQELIDRRVGWRAVLDLLIRRGLVEKTRAESLFEIRKGIESANWNRLFN